MSSSKLWKITGPIPRAPLSLLYRGAALLAALCMILLPLIYVGIIAALSWWLWHHAQHNFAKGDNLWLYLTPLVAGPVVLLFMIKPLFSRRPRPVKPRQLLPQEEPVLFALIAEICDAVGAPRPRRVEVDTQVNASAALSHGIWSLFTRNLTLTIGMPLAGGLRARELAGVLAHEFGHFAQGSGMVTTYAVRTVSFWFARVVYERDSWDETLERWARSSDWRIMIVLQISRLFVWLTRRILWVLMLIGQIISSVLMRQMEYDADHWEIQLSGSESFITTARRLRVLGLGAHFATERMGEAFSVRRLVDDLPGYMLHISDSLPQEVLTALAKSEAEEKTGWMDTHPANRERIAAAERAAAPGVLEMDAPGPALFADFPALCREITNHYYRDALQLPMHSLELLPLAEVTAGDDAERKGGETMEALFHGILSPDAMIFILPCDLRPGSPELIQLNRAARTAPSGEMKAAAAELLETRATFLLTRQLMALNAARIRVVPEPDWKFTSTKTTDLMETGKTASQRMEQLAAEIAPALGMFQERITTALCWFLHRQETPSALKNEVQSYLAALQAFEEAREFLKPLHTEVTGMSAVLGALERQTDQQEVYRFMDATSDRMGPMISKVLECTQRTAFPLPHAGGRTMLSAHLVADVSHPDSVVRRFLEGESILQRYYDTYSKIMGRLAVLTLEAEAAMDLHSGPLPDTAPA